MYNKIGQFDIFFNILKSKNNENVENEDQN